MIMIVMIVHQTVMMRGMPREIIVNTVVIASYGRNHTIVIVVTTTASKQPVQDD